MEKSERRVCVVANSWLSGTSSFTESASRTESLASCICWGQVRIQRQIQKYNHYGNYKHGDKNKQTADSAAGLKAWQAVPTATAGAKSGPPDSGNRCHPTLVRTLELMADIPGRQTTKQQIVQAKIQHILKLTNPEIKKTKVFLTSCSQACTVCVHSISRPPPTLSRKAPPRLSQNRIPQTWIKSFAEGRKIVSRLL